ncbi:hypothetical protein [Labedella endophytica]|uniref:Ig-like domain-containing protein n=1 Tax=Labedella endophytica TaxID=1523160 RepID=A0A433JW72_9MICO|nr:hypothetical protein [Labedella endophytica]RUR03238.1 hypothetical protein ELQ94_01405 [Labedella endophytica]
MDKRPLLVTSALALVIALAGCGNGTAGSVSTDAATSTPSMTPSATAPAPSVSPEPTPAPTETTAPTPAATWTGETAYDACIAFHRKKTEAAGFDPDASTWNDYSPEVVRQNGDQWTVDLIGTVTADNGTTNEGVFSCAVAGTPASPRVTEFTGG